MRESQCYRAFLGILLLLFAGGAQARAGVVATSLEGTRVDLFDESRKGVLVLLFVAVECPISNRFAPSVNAIYEEYGSSDLEMWTVYTDDLFLADEIRKHRGDYRYRMPALIDFEHELAAYCGATVTPEAVVFFREESGAYRMVYRGRIDNQYVDFGKWRLKATQQDLREVLDVIREGKGGELELRTTEAVGCYIGEASK